MSSCSSDPPYFARLEPSGEISLALCYEPKEFTSVEMRLTTPVAGDESSFEERTIMLSGPAVTLTEGSVLQLPLVADGWQASPDFEVAGNWTYAEIAFANPSGTTFLAEGFGRTDLESGEWVRIGSEDSACHPPD